MPNVQPVEGFIPNAGTHPSLVASEAIFAQVPGIKDAIDAVAETLNESGTLSPRLVELVRIRMAFHNQCRVCMAFRYIPDEVGEDLVCSLERPAEAEDLTDAERAALQFADLFATNHLAIDAAVYDNLRLYFTEPQLVALGVRCAFLLGVGRLSATWDCDEHLPASFTVDARTTPWGHEQVLSNAI